MLLHISFYYVSKGSFQYGRRDGKGKLTLPIGLTYEGDFRDGKPHGRGVMYSSLSGYTFEGKKTK
jgi:hypothetical protein